MIDSEYTQENPRINWQDRQEIMLLGSAYPKEIFQKCTLTKHRSSALPEGPLGGLPSVSWSLKAPSCTLGQAHQASRQPSDASTLQRVCHFGIYQFTKERGKLIIFTLRASCGTVYCNRFCLCVCVWMGLLPRLLEILCIDPHQTEFVGKGSDHLKLIKFWPSHAPGRGLCLTTASMQCLHLLRALFSLIYETSFFECGKWQHHVEKLINDHKHLA